MILRFKPRKWLKKNQNKTQEKLPVTPVLKLLFDISYYYSSEERVGETAFPQDQSKYIP